MRITNIFLRITLAAGTLSCNNSELESRITKLEGRVAALETSKGVGAIPKRNQLNATDSDATTPLTMEKPEGPLPEFQFENESHDFGSIKEGDVVEHIFTFTNSGEAPLIISDAKATCGCTVPEWPKEPIPVGGSGQIKVQFNSKGKPGVQNKTVTLTSNTWPTTKRLQIKSNVVKEETK